MKKLLSLFAVFIFIVVFVACGYENYPMSEDTRALENTEIEEMFSNSDYPIHDDISELIEDATLIVRVEVLNDGVPELRNTVTILPDPIPEEMLEDFRRGFLTRCMFEPRYCIYTVYQVRILENYKGNHQVGDVLEVLQRGGTLDGVRHTSCSYISFSVGDDLVLFLLQEYVGGHTMLMTPWQAVYHFPPEERGRSILSENDDNIVLEVIDERNELTLTLGDLRGDGV
ncbi:MAG: hypothetical protein FWF76_01690 [Oscillospiraceae bacterium]|nr:hypothetical protein [Oscillospiraceae bacterium]